MNPSAFDRISKHFAERRLTRRQAIASGGPGIAGAAIAARFAPVSAQEGTPEVVETEPWDGEKTTYLFVQSFHSGSIIPMEGQDGRYTVTLEQGTGQTIYFADRPSRDVGVAETSQFLDGLGFLEDNPPNAALILETAPGESDVAVVELFNPSYDPVTAGVTYEVAALENWRQSVELGLEEDPADLAALAPEFGAAHLLIDDCPTNSTVYCVRGAGTRPIGSFWPVDSCWNFFVCMPCEPYVHDQPDRCATQDYWSQKCNDTFPECQRLCKSDFSWPFANC